MMENRALKVPSAPAAIPMPIIFKEISGRKTFKFIPTKIIAPAKIKMVFLPYTSAKLSKTRQIMVFNIRTVDLAESLSLDLSQ